MFSIIKEGRPEGRPSNFGSSRALTRLGFRHRAIRSTLHEAELAGILEFGLRNLPIIVGVGQLEVGDVRKLPGRTTGNRRYWQPDSKDSGTDYHSGLH